MQTISNYLQSSHIIIICLAIKISVSVQIQSGNWLLENKLLLNKNKTELLNISLTEVNFPVVTLGDIIIKPSLKVKSLGFIINNKLSFKLQISNIFKTANMSLYKIKAIRNCLNSNTCILLIHSLVFSRIDYAHSLYCNLPNYRLNKLNMIIRSSVRIRHNLKLLDTDKSAFLNLYYLSTT